MITEVPKEVHPVRTTTKAKTATTAAVEGRTTTTKTKTSPRGVVTVGGRIGTKVKQASIDVGDDATTLERFRRIASQHQKQQQNQEQEHREQVEVLKEEEDEDKQQQVSDRRNFPERIKRIFSAIERRNEQ